MNQYLVAIFLFCLVPPLAFSQGTGQLLSDSESAKKLTPQQPEERILDHFVPIVTMEQMYFQQGNFQGYRLKIFKDGRGIYQGLSHVKTLGERGFHLQPEQVNRILDKFDSYKVWSIPENQIGDLALFSFLRLEINLRASTRTKTVRFAGQGHGGILQKTLEDEVNSSRWRCPYIDSRNVELCGALDRYFERSVSRFLKYEFPILLETYK